jgi:hypothetical protein
MNILLTGGCSFSVAKHECWPYHLENYIKPEQSIHTGISCQGNDLISKKILRQLFDLVENHNTSELLVGIMWSGPARKAIYLESPSSDLLKLSGCPENPTAVFTDSNWYILNSADYGKNGISRIYFKNFYSLVNSYVETCQDILRVQWFLQKNNIKYFMSTFTENTLPTSMKSMSEVSYLYSQIDFDHFLPVIGELEWCREHYMSESNTNDDLHPTPIQHKKFTDEVIIPFLKKKKYI